MLLFSNSIALLNEAILTHKQSINFPINSLILKVLTILCKLNLLVNFVITTSYKNKKNRLGATVFFKPALLNRPVIRSIKIISTCSSSVFVTYNKLLRLNISSNLTLALISTNKGILTVDEAISLKIGGKLLCIIS